MAKVENNLFLLGIRGMIGNQMVYRNCKGKIILSKRPQCTGYQSDAQKKQRLRFKEATIYAKAALTDADTFKAYSEKAQHSEDALTAYNVAVADYLNLPVIKTVHLDEYSGQPGEGIVVSATDDFEVKEVTVKIRQNDYTLVEKGIALADANGLDWKYTTQSANIPLTGSMVTIRVSDRPGNVTVKEMVI
ncbi:MAG: hypothetical protein LBV72_00155 [Tannerella sp.]|jgi:hypothetical protein|nr:hypothetical protein [Tannerella sp.]